MESLVTTILTEITSLRADVTTVGSAMFGVLLVLVAFAYFRRSAK